MTRMILFNVLECVFITREEITVAVDEIVSLSWKCLEGRGCGGGVSQIRTDNSRSKVTSTIKVELKEKWICAVKLIGNENDLYS